eukprot:g1342.t1
MATYQVAANIGFWQAALCPEWRQKHGIVPDISVTGFYGRVRELYELKGLRYSGGPHGLYTDAPPPAAGSPAISAVEARERRISGDVRGGQQRQDLGTTWLQRNN